MKHILLLTCEKKNGTTFTSQGWGPKGPGPSWPCAGREDKDDSNVAPFRRTRLTKSPTFYQILCGPSIFYHI